MSQIPTFEKYFLKFLIQKIKILREILETSVELLEVSRSFLKFLDFLEEFLKTRPWQIDKSFAVELYKSSLFTVKLRIFLHLNLIEVNISRYIIPTTNIIT